MKKHWKIARLILLWSISLIWVYALLKMYFRDDWAGLVLWSLLFLAFTGVVVGLQYKEGNYHAAESFLSNIIFPLLIIYPFLPYLAIKKSIISFLGIEHFPIIQENTEHRQKFEVLGYILVCLFVYACIRFLFRLLLKTVFSHYKRMIFFTLFFYTFLITLLTFFAGIPEVIEILRNSKYVLLGKVIRHFEWMRQTLSNEILFGVPALVGVFLLFYINDILKPMVEKSNL